MKVSKTIEREDGDVTFTGELNKEELDLVISMGLNQLLRMGALPMTATEPSNVAPVSEEMQ